MRLWGWFRQNIDDASCVNPNYSPSRRYFVKTFRAWYPNAHLQRETYCGSQDSLEQLARKFANVFLCRRRFICNHSGLNAVYVEPRWRPSTVDSEQLRETLTQGGFEAGSPFCFWIKYEELHKRLAERNWWYVLICVLTCFVYARHYGTVSRNRKLVFGSRWLVWENHSRNDFHDCSGCISKSTPKSVFLVSLHVATASPKETIWICNVWFIVNQPNQFKTLYWWLKSWWRESCFAEGCLWSAWLPLNFVWHRCEASNAANTLRYFAFLGCTARKGHG